MWSWPSLVPLQSIDSVARNDLGSPESGAMVNTKFICYQIMFKLRKRKDRHYDELRMVNLHTSFRALPRAGVQRVACLNARGLTYSCPTYLLRQRRTGIHEKVERRSVFSRLEVGGGSWWCGLVLRDWV